MEKDLKKLALLGIASGLFCLSATEAPIETDSKEISMGKTCDTPRPEECKRCDGLGVPRKEAEDCRAHSGCGGTSDEFYDDDDRSNESCKPARVGRRERRSAASKAMDE